MAGFGLPDALNFPLALMQGADTGFNQIAAGLGNYFNRQQQLDLQSQLNQSQEAGTGAAFDTSLAGQAQNQSSYLNRYNTLADQTIAGNRAIPGLMDALRSRSMGYLDNQGMQERRDINTQFDANRSAGLADLTSRGLANTTILPGLNAMNERYRSDALGGLAERLNQQRLGTDMATTGNYANALQWQQGNEQALRFGGAENAYNLGQQLNQNSLQAELQKMGIHAQGIQGLMSLFGDTQINYPDQGLSAQLAGNLGTGPGTAAGRPPPNPFWGIFGSQVGGAALGGAATVGTAYGLNGLLGAGGGGGVIRNLPFPIMNDFPV